MGYGQDLKVEAPERKLVELRLQWYGHMLWMDNLISFRA